MLSERLQVLVYPTQRRRLEEIARERGMSVGALIREAIEAYTGAVVRSRRDALDALFDLEAPVADWDTMKDEIERGALR